jgi:hypothetical protein
MFFPYWCREDIQWIRDLPYTISIPQFNAIVVHAGLVPGVPLHEQRHCDMTRMRNIITLNPSKK